MGKYFSNDTNFSNYPINDDGGVIVTNNNITNIPDENLISDNQKHILSQNNELDRIKLQNIELQKMIDSYTKESNTTISNQFNNFTSGEIFEKLNQLIFVVSNLSNRISDLEKSLQSNHRDTIQIKNEEKIISDPAQLMEFEKNLSISSIQSKLEDIKQGKILPNEDYIDNSVRLEEMFPQLDDEAYQAGYNALSKIKPTNSKSSDITIGQMRNGTAGF